MIYIVIPVFNRLHFTKECIASLRQQTFSDFKIILVDDGSTDSTAEWVRRNHPDIDILHGDGQLWWTGCMNLGVKHALQLSRTDGDYVLSLNNDLIVRKDYLEKIMAISVRHPAALIGSVSVDITAPEVVHFAGTSWNSRTARYRSSVEKEIGYPALAEKSEVVKTDLLPGRGVLIPVSVFKEIGMYDQEHFPHYMADEDFALRAKKAGYSLLISTAAVVYNHVNESGLKSKRRNLRYYADVFTSIKSPANTLYRWHWAKRHASVPPTLYFAIDTMRILKSLVFK